MENKLLVEMGRIKSIMGINEPLEVLSEGPIDGIISRFVINLAREDERLILKFFERDVSKRITTDADKIAFSEYVKSVEGKDFIRNLESEITRMSNPDAKKMARRQLSKMKNSAKQWENIINVVPPPIIKPLTDEANALFSNLKNIASLSEKNIETLNKAADDIMNGTIRNYSTTQLLKLTNELKNFGVNIERLMSEAEKNENLLVNLKNKNQQKKWEGIKASVKKFNEVCNLVIDAIRGNKPIMYILKGIKYLLKCVLWIGAALYGISLVVKWAIGGVKSAVSKITEIDWWDLISSTGSDNKDKKEEPPQPDNKNNQPPQPDNKNNQPIPDDNREKIDW